MINFNDNLNISAPKPIDTRYQVADEAAMNAITQLYYGLLTYRLDNEKWYLYKNDDAWHEYATGSTGIDPTVQAHMDNDGIHVTSPQSDALDASTNPSSSNAYATIGDLTVYGLTRVFETAALMAAWTTATEGDRAIVWNNVADPAKNGEWIAETTNPASESDWLLLPDQNTVTSVAGKTGAITLLTSDISDYTDTTVNSVLHNNENGASIPNGAQWVYDSGDSEMKLQLSGGGALSSAITSTVDIGGIKEGQVFTIGTPLEDLWFALLNKMTLDSFSITGSHGSNTTLEVGTATSITQFDYKTKGSPTSMTINDSEGTMGIESVSGSQYVPGAPDTYNYADYKIVTWYLKSAAATPSQLTRSLKWVHPAYYGVNTNTSGFPTTVAEIEAGTKSVQDTTGSVTVSPGASNQYFWIAVEQTQSDSYTQWDASTASNPYNKGNIGLGNLVLPSVTIDDGSGSGKTYDLYKSDYATDLLVPIELT